MASFVTAKVDVGCYKERPVDFAENMEVKGGEFRLNNRRIMLTYTSHLPKEEFTEWLGRQCKPYIIKEIYIAHETGEDVKNPYDHTHVCLDFGKPFQTRRCRKFDYTEIHPHIRKILTALHWKNAVRYMAKEDVSCLELEKYKGEVADKFDVELLWQCKSLHEAMVMFCNDERKAAGIKLLWEMRDIAEPEFRSAPLDVLLPWQQHVWNVCLGKPDDREIFFVVNEEAGCGKSLFLAHLHDHFPKTVGVVSMGRPQDMGDVLYDQLDRGKVDVIVVDCPMGHFFERQHLSTLESFKDGRWSKTKHKGRLVRMARPHIIVFTNRNIMSLIATEGREWIARDRCVGIRVRGNIKAGEDTSFYVLKPPNPEDEPEEISIGSENMKKLHAKMRATKRLPLRQDAEEEE